MTYDIWMKCFPQSDENISELWDIQPMEKTEAEEFIEEMEHDYSDESWNGHKLYRAKFYIEEHGKYETPCRNVWDFVEIGPSIYYE